MEAMNLAQPAVPSTSKQQPQIHCASASGDLDDKMRKKEAINLPQPVFPSTSKPEPQMQPKKVPRAQVNRNEKEKLRVLRQLRNGMKRAEACRLYKIPESTLRGWITDGKLRSKLEAEKSVTPEEKVLGEKMSDEDLRMHMRRWELYWFEEYAYETKAPNYPLDLSKKMR